MGTAVESVHHDAGHRVVTHPLAAVRADVGVAVVQQLPDQDTRAGGSVWPRLESAF